MKTFLFDNPEDKEKVGFLFKENKAGRTIIFSPKDKKLFVAWTKGVKATLAQTTDNDTIVCWYDFQAILCYWFALLTFRHRKIVCVNLLLKDKNTLKNKVVSWLYKKALNSKHFVASVTSVEYGEYLKKRLGVKRLFLLHDVFHETYKHTEVVQIVSNTVFCGGRNGRDWQFMIEVARSMPNVDFHLVMPQSTYDECKNVLPSNVYAKFNLSMEEFMREMCSCEIVALPLDTEAPAGLIVLFQAAANMKYIITTDTMTTREYLGDGRGCLVENNIEIWVNAINQRLGTENIEASSQLLKFLETECSERKFIEGIESMIKEVQ